MPRAPRGTLKRFIGFKVEPSANRLADRLDAWATPEVIEALRDASRPIRPNSGTVTSRSGGTCSPSPTSPARTGPRPPARPRSRSTSGTRTSPATASACCCLPTSNARSTRPRQTDSPRPSCSSSSPPTRRDLGQVVGCRAEPRRSPSRGGRRSRSQAEGVPQARRQTDQAAHDPDA